MRSAVQNMTWRMDALIQPIVRTLGIVVVPAGALALLHRLTAGGASLPPQLLDLELYGPYAALSVAGLISVWFNRGRAFLGLLCLAAGYVVYGALPSAEIDSDLAERAFVVLCALVPLNLAALSLLPERGLFNAFGFRRLLLLALQVTAIGLLLRAGFTGVADWLSAPHAELSWLHAAPIPPRVVPIVLLGVILATIAAVLRDARIDGALCGSIVAFVLACYSAQRPSEFGLLISIAALLIMIGVLQDSYRMAFRDELTGLPSRRSLNERLMSLGHRFTIAMLDIDHFKRFNDSYGHEAGDHVLKMVAAKLSQVGAGARAYRYGGEEFALVFPDRSPRRVLQELEALRVRVAEHRLALRSTQRPAKTKLGRTLRVSNGTKHDGVSLTVSIGLAERNDKHRRPEQVLRAADRALYRAKEKGRNRVSR